MRPWRNATGRFALVLLIAGASAEPTAGQSAHGFCYFGDVEIHDVRFQGTGADATTISGTVYFSDVFPIGSDATLFQASTGFQSYIEQQVGIETKDEITRRGRGASLDIQREHAYVRCPQRPSLAAANSLLRIMYNRFPIYLFQDLRILVNDSNRIAVCADRIKFDEFQFRITNTVRSTDTNWKPSVQ